MTPQCHQNARMADVGAVPSKAVVRVRLDVAYVGSGFHGFAENRGVRTVGGELRAALEQVLRVPVELTCAGRTDTGVHARGQVVTVDLEAGFLDSFGRLDRGGPPATERLRDSLNGLVGPAIAVRDVVAVDDDFDARFSARSRTYRYSVWNAPAPDPFLADRAWWIDEPLDVPSMAVAGGLLVGEHDFSAFCRRPKPSSAHPAPVSLVRRVLSTAWEADADHRGLLTFTVSATAFCHQMVRSITGLLVEVGRGRRTPEDVTTALARGDRALAGRLAPPHGLVLWEVEY